MAPWAIRRELGPWAPRAGCSDFALDNTGGASFSALAPNVMDGSEWNGVAWNYN
jgi:hypothetical protein